MFFISLESTLCNLLHACFYILKAFFKYSESPKNVTSCIKCTQLLSMTCGCGNYLNPNNLLKWIEMNWIDARSYILTMPGYHVLILYLWVVHLVFPDKNLYTGHPISSKYRKGLWYIIRLPEWYDMQADGKSGKTIYMTNIPIIDFAWANTRRYTIANKSN